MSKDSFWDLTNRPYTKLKLEILDKYLKEWTNIFFNTALKHKNWSKWQDIYYIDCFAGRGKYHCDGKKDLIDGSPLIAIKHALRFQQDPQYKGIKMHFIFIEEDKNNSDCLKEFCKSHKSNIDIKIYDKSDFNKVISEIIDKTNYHPAFFFIDPGGIKGLKRNSLEKIVGRKGATDILLNYIKGGVERIAGLARKRIPKILDQTISDKDVKAIKCLTDFYGMGILDNLDATEEKRLKEWAKSIFDSENSELKEKVVFNMPYLRKSDNIYYLIFASRRNLAKKIILTIFKNAKKTDFRGQGRLDIFGDQEFEIQE